MVSFQCISNSLGDFELLRTLRHFVKRMTSIIQDNETRLLSLLQTSSVENLKIFQVALSLEQQIQREHLNKRLSNTPQSIYASTVLKKKQRELQLFKIGFCSFLRELFSNQTMAILSDYAKFLSIFCHFLYFCHLKTMQLSFFRKDSGCFFFSHADCSCKVTRESFKHMF